MLRFERFDRIEKLRQNFLETGNTGWRSPEGDLLYYRSWAKICNMSQALRSAHAKADMLRGQTPFMWDGELVVGKPNYRKLTDEEQK